MTDSKNYVVTLKDTASAEDVDSFKLKIGLLGGKVIEEFSLIKGFLVKMPKVAADSVLDHHLVHSIEEDKEMKIQS